MENERVDAVRAGNDAANDEDATEYFSFGNYAIPGDIADGKGRIEFINANNNGNIMFSSDIEKADQEVVSPPQTPIRPGVANYNFGSTFDASTVDLQQQQQEQQHLEQQEQEQQLEQQEQQLEPQQELQQEQQEQQHEQQHEEQHEQQHEPQDQHQLKQDQQQLPQLQQQQLQEKQLEPQQKQQLEPQQEQEQQHEQQLEPQQKQEQQHEQQLEPQQEQQLEQQEQKQEQKQQQLQEQLERQLEQQQQQYQQQQQQQQLEQQQKQVAQQQQQQNSPSQDIFRPFSPSEPARSSSEDGKPNNEKEHMKGKDEEEGARFPQSPILTSPSSSSYNNGVGEGLSGDEHQISLRIYGEPDTGKSRGSSTKIQEELSNDRLFLQTQILTTIKTILCLAVFSVLGEALRVFLSDVFGGQCEDGNPTWLNPTVTTLNLCITSSISPLFADLPANMLGCFIMGLLQPCEDVGLHNSNPISFLSHRHWFQSWTVMHLGLRTGFCGSLTTFASWNTQMVTMMDGTVAGKGESLFFSAFFGYIIGLEAAMASLTLGQNVGVWLHRYVNPRLAKAEDVANETSLLSTNAADAARRRDKRLPDFERQFLDSLLLDEEVMMLQESDDAVADLQQWKNTTAKNRKESALLRGLVEEMEHMILMEGRRPPHALLLIAQEYGWDIDALWRWAQAETTQTEKFASRLHDNSYFLSGCFEGRGQTSPASRKNTILQLICAAGPVVIASCIIVAFGLLAFSGTKQWEQFYRTAWLSTLVAPFGTLLRWKLSTLNGKLKLTGNWKKHNLSWFPLGTFLANIIACILSALSVAIVYRIGPVGGNSEGWSYHVWEALKTGFAGSLSTVSTYVVEGDKLQKTYPQRAKGYQYLTGSLVVAGLLGLMLYSPLVRTAT